jgi:hypothetical protein
MDSDEFTISSVDGTGRLEFFNRVPEDRDNPIGRFSVRIVQHRLDANIEVYAAYAAVLGLYSVDNVPAKPAGLFSQMANRWTGWDHLLTWESLEGELTLRCSHDGWGHIAIKVNMRSGPYPTDWAVEATIMSEAGQMDAIARRAALFFGKYE